MGDTDCDHPRSSVTIVVTEVTEVEGDFVPEHWTVIGECSCGEMVDVGYTSNEIA